MLCKFLQLLNDFHLFALDKDLPEKYNLLVTEIFDSELIGEGVLPTVRHARESLLQVQYERLQSLIFPVIDP